MFVTTGSDTIFCRVVLLGSYSFAYDLPHTKIHISSANVSLVLIKPNPEENFHMVMLQKEIKKKRNFIFFENPLPTPLHRKS
jgi:hypothetical protein